MHFNSIKNIETADEIADRASDTSSIATPQNKISGIGLTRAAILFGIIVATCFAAILAITLYKNSKGEIGSRTYNQIISSHELVDDVFPPSVFAIEAYANILHTLRYTTQAEKNLVKFKEQRALFDERIEHWKNSDIPAEVRDTITVDAAGALTKFWDVAEVDFFGELISKPSANVHRAVDKINVAFTQHREAIVVAKQQIEIYLEEREVATATNISTLNMIYYAIVAASMLVLVTALAITRNYLILPMTQIADYTTQLAMGSDVGNVPHTNRKDEIGAIATALTKFRDANYEKIETEKNITSERERVAELSIISDAERADRERETAKAIDAIGSALKRMAQGDLSCRIDQPFNGELDRLRTDLNSAIAQFGNTFTKILNTSESLGTGVREIVTASDDLSVRTEKQAASLEETANTLAQITKTVQSASEGAENTRVIVETAKTDAQISGVVVEKALTAMGEIETSAKEINQIISVIDEIAFQTNLLALNAGVEAARAGDAGLGFAVVASEVRALAQRSATAAKEIKELISKSTEQVAGGSKLVSETGEALHKIADQVLEISVVVDEIAVGAKEQFKSLNDLNASVSEMDAGTQQNAAMAEEATAACHSLRNEADELTNLMSAFKVGGAGSNTINRAANIPAANSNAAATKKAPAKRIIKTTTIATEHHKPAKSPAKNLISRVTSAFSSNAAVNDEEWEEF